jgi:hypothetical protein
VGSRVKRALIAALLLSTLTAAPALAESAKPSPKVTAKPTAKATAKPTASAKPTAKATAKPTAKVTATAKPTPKPTATKKKVVKKKKKKVRVSPSPRVSWPPKGFTVEGDVFARIPTSKELVGIVSAQKSLALQIKDCESFICGAVQVAAATGCTWWEVKSDVLNGSNVKLGDLSTSHSASKPREIKTILTVSPESISAGGRAKIVTVLCHQEPRDSAAATVTYTKVITE